MPPASSRIGLIQKGGGRAPMTATKGAAPGGAGGSSSRRPVGTGNGPKRKMDRIEIGMHVDIQRSDGRVHGAVVSQLKPERMAVLVEWFEKGETKGKEIDLATLHAINPTLKGKDTLSRSLQQTALDEDNDENETLLDVPIPPKKSVVAPRRTIAETSVAQGAQQRRSMLMSNGSTEALDAYVPTRPAATQKVPSPVAAVPAPTQAKLQAPTSRRVAAISQSATTTPVVENAAPIPKAMIRSVEKIEEDINQTIQMETKTNQKSTTVSNIEKLQRDRDERRAQQDKFKKQKEIEQGIAPGSPDYQFLLMIREYQSQIDYRPLKMSDPVTDTRISVCVRKRPLNKKEINKKEIEVITIPNRDHLIVHQPQVKVDLTKYVDNQKFRFDYTFDENTTNEMVYKFTAQPLVKTIFEQGFATCFAYGQTGSGKTHTMGGDFNGKNQNCAGGIYALTASDVFKLLHEKYRHKNLTVGCSFFEIYGGKVFDLLNSKALLRILEDGKKEVQVVGLKEDEVTCEDDVLDLIRRGTEMRTAGATSANSNSSRSHAVFQIVLRKGPKTWGKFSLIDLAGNERGQDTGNSDRQTRMEGAEINKSLLALKECIRAMARNSTHVPFRSSKLTLVLRDSFMGEKARTCMIAMISPGMSSCEHTLNTLRYADRVKELGAEEGGSNTPMDDEEFMLARENSDDEDADLSLVCSRNGTDKTTFDMMKVVTAMTAAEEQSLEEHYNLADSINNWSKDLKTLMKRTSNVDYDHEKYARDTIAALTKWRNQVDDAICTTDKWHKLIGQEAEMSKKAAASSRKK